MLIVACTISFCDVSRLQAKPVHISEMQEQKKNQRKKRGQDESFWMAADNHQARDAAKDIRAHRNGLDLGQSPIPKPTTVSLVSPPAVRASTDPTVEGRMKRMRKRLLESDRLDEQAFRSAYTALTDMDEDGLGFNFVSDSYAAGLSTQQATDKFIKLNMGGSS